MGWSAGPIVASRKQIVSAHAFVLFRYGNADKGSAPYARKPRNVRDGGITSILPFREALRQRRVSFMDKSEFSDGIAVLLRGKKVVIIWRGSSRSEPRVEPARQRRT